MIRTITSILLVLTIFQIGTAQDISGTAEISQLSKIDTDRLLAENSRKPLTVTERINLYSKMFLGMPYLVNCTGDGPYALYETDPLVNFNATNCMVFCEHVLAMAISDSWDNFFNNLQQIRYRDGIIGIRTRNHYTMADWLPENCWLLEDVTNKIGGTAAQTITRIISHETFFSKKGITDLRYVKPDREISIDIIPKTKLRSIGNRINTGDILVLIFADKPDIFAAHMVLAATEDNQLLIREATTHQMQTIETDYDQWAKEIEVSNRYIGISILRVHDELNQPGQVILPWNIQQLKLH